MSRPSKYSAKEKEKIVEMCLSGKNCWVYTKQYIAQE